MKHLRVLIVDDEPLAREGIRHFLQDEEAEIVGEASNGKEAVKQISQHNPDLVYLDVQMPELDGFEVLEGLSLQNLPYIIFVTAYDQYALRAFEVNAIDYLLKPLDEERFRLSFQRAKSVIEKDERKDLRENLQALTGYLKRKATERILVKTGGRIYFIRATEIDWIEAQGNYVLLHVGKESHMVREPIGAMETELQGKGFLRIHRSTVVNVERIRELRQLLHGDYRVWLHDGTQLTLSRRYRNKAREVLGQNL
jgi:two-component system, LytTR family, response regulator